MAQRLEMADMPNDLAIWYQTVPHIAQPGEAMDTMVKLRRPTQKLVRISVVLSNGEEVSAVVEPEPPSLKFSFIGYSKDSDRVYLYLENTGKDNLKIKKLFCNTKDITGSCFVPERVIAPSSKALVIFKPEPRLQTGKYKVFKALTDEGVVAAATSRVYSHFPITAFGGDTRAELGFDQEPFEMHYLGDPAEFEKLKNEPAHKVYHLFDDPTCVDGGARQLIGTSAREIISRARKCFENDPLHPNLIYACEYAKPYCYLVYGEIVDILAVDPYEMFFYQKQPLDNAAKIAPVSKVREEMECEYAKSVAGALKFLVNNLNF